MHQNRLWRDETQPRQSLNRGWGLGAVLGRPGYYLTGDGPLRELPLDSQGQWLRCGQSPANDVVEALVAGLLLMPLLPPSRPGPCRGPIVLGRLDSLSALRSPQEAPPGGRDRVSSQPGRLPDSETGLPRFLGKNRYCRERLAKADSNGRIAGDPGKNRLFGGLYGLLETLGVTGSSPVSPTDGLDWRKAFRGRALRTQTPPRRGSS